MNYDELLDLFKQRRSTRAFKPDAVPDEYVDKIVEAGRWAPSGFQPATLGVCRCERSETEGRHRTNLQGGRGAERPDGGHQGVLAGDREAALPNRTRW